MDGRPGRAGTTRVLAYECCRADCPGGRVSTAWSLRGSSGGNGRHLAHGHMARPCCALDVSVSPDEYFEMGPGPAGQGRTGTWRLESAAPTRLTEGARVLLMRRTISRG